MYYCCLSASVNKSACQFINASTLCISSLIDTSLFSNKIDFLFQLYCTKCSHVVGCFVKIHREVLTNSAIGQRHNRILTVYAPPRQENCPCGSVSRWASRSCFVFLCFVSFVDAFVLLCGSKLAHASVSTYWDEICCE